MARKKAAIPKPEYSINDYVMYKGEAGDLKIGEIEAITVFIREKSTEISYGLKGGADVAQGRVTGKVTLEKKRAPRTPKVKTATPTSVTAETTQTAAPAH
jgi:hypothetical protein